MISHEIRICDVCEVEIQKCTTYRKVTMSPEAADLLTSNEDPDIRATYTVNPDGTVTIDICSICLLSMGPLPGKEQIN